MEELTQLPRIKPQRKVDDSDDNVDNGSDSKKGRDDSCCNKPSSEFIPESCDGPCDQMDFRKAVNSEGAFYTGNFRGKGLDVVHNNNAYANDVMRRIIAFAAGKIREDTRFATEFAGKTDDEVYDAHRKLYLLIKSYATYVEFNDDLYAAAINLLKKLYRQVAFSLISSFTRFYFEFLKSNESKCDSIDLPRDFHRFYLEFSIDGEITTSRKDVIAITLTYFLTCTGRLDQELQQMMEFRPTVAEVNLDCLYLFSGLTAWPPHVIIGLKTTRMLNLYKSFTFNYEYARDRYARKYTDIVPVPDSTFVVIPPGQLAAIYTTYENTRNNIKSVGDPVDLNCTLPLKIILVLKLGPDDKLCYISDTSTWEWEILIRSGYFTYMSHKYVIYAVYGFNILEICINFEPDPTLISEPIFGTVMDAFVRCIATKYEGFETADWRDEGEFPDPLYTPEEMAKYRTIFETAKAESGGGYATFSKKAGGGGYATENSGRKGGKKRRKSIRTKTKNRRNKTYKKSKKSVKSVKSVKKKLRSSRKLY